MLSTQVDPVIPGLDWQDILEITRSHIEGHCSVEKFINCIRESFNPYPFSSKINNLLEEVIHKLLGTEDDSIPFLKTSSLNSFNKPETVPICNLNQFLQRFGPWPNLLQNIVGFLFDAEARNWFIGKFTSDKATKILQQEDQTIPYYFIRSVTVEETYTDKYYVFALTFKHNGKITHHRIFKNKKSPEYYLQIDQKTFKPYDSFRMLLQDSISMLPKEKTPLANRALDLGDQYEFSVVPQNSLLDYIFPVTK